MEQVLVSRGPRAGFALIKGVIPAEERTVSDLLDTITAGSATDLDPGPPNSARIKGQVQARRLSGARAGQGSRRHRSASRWATASLVTSPQGELNAARAGLIPKYQRFRVAGIFHSGFYQYDSAHGLHASRRRAAPLQRARPAVRHQLQGGQPRSRAGDWASNRASRRQGLHDHQLDGAESRALPRAQAGAGGHVHRDRADRHRGRAQHSHRAHHDGDGEDARHRRDDELWRRAGQVRRIFLLQGF